VKSGDEEKKEGATRTAPKFSAERSTWRGRADAAAGHIRPSFRDRSACRVVFLLRSVGLLRFAEWEKDGAVAARGASFGTPNSGHGSHLGEQVTKEQEDLESKQGSGGNGPTEEKARMDQDGHAVRSRALVPPILSPRQPFVRPSFRRALQSQMAAELPADPPKHKAYDYCHSTIQEDRQAALEVEQRVEQRIKKAAWDKAASELPASELSQDQKEDGAARQLQTRYLCVCLFVELEQRAVLHACPSHGSGMGATAEEEG
jgi:hypothetical protein